MTVFYFCTGAVTELITPTLFPLLTWEDSTALRMDALVSMLLIDLDLYLFFLWIAATLVFSLLIVSLSVCLGVAILADGYIGVLVRWCTGDVSSSVWRGCAISSMALAVCIALNQY